MPFDRSSWSNKTSPETNQNLIGREDSAKKLFLSLLYYYFIIILLSFWWKKALPPLNCGKSKSKNSPA